MVSMSKGQADAASAALTRARQNVLAVIAGSGGSAEVPAFQAAGTGRPVPTPLQQRLPFVVAAVDLVLLVIAVAIGNYVLAAGAAVLFIATALLAVVNKRALAAGAGRAPAIAPVRWTSRQAWQGPLAFTQERALVVAATQAAQRITRAPVWGTSELDQRGARPDLAADLERIDEQAYRVASLRYDGATGGLPVARPVGPDVEQAWNRAVDAVASLTCFADSLDGLDTAARAAAAQRPQITVAPSDLHFDDGTQLRPEELAMLLFFLNGAQLGEGS